MCGRLKWRTNAWRFSAARSSGIPRINLATCTYPRGWIGLPAIGERGGRGGGLEFLQKGDEINKHIP